MSEPRNNATARENGAAAPAAARHRNVAIALAGALILVIALLVTGPLWAPQLPWSARPARDDTALVERLDRLAAAQEEIGQQSRQEAAATSAALEKLDQRVGALEARPATPVGDVTEIRRQLANLTSMATDLAARIDAVAKTAQARETGDPAETALVFALLRIRDAVEAGRPFAAAYESLAALAGNRPEIAAAAAPLAEPAKTGVPGRAVLVSRLRELERTLTAANAAAAELADSNPTKADGAAADWTGQLVNRLRGLVTIRRIDSATRPQPTGSIAAEIKTAELALAGGDLEGAVGALGRLTGAPAEAARPWLRMANERLAVEAALRQTEAVLAERLGIAANASAGAGPPR